MEQTINELERKMEEKDRELHAIKLDNEAVGFFLCVCSIIASCALQNVWLASLVEYDRCSLFLQAWAKEDLLREQSKELQSFRCVFGILMISTLAVVCSYVFKLNKNIIITISILT